MALSSRRNWSALGALGLLSLLAVVQAFGFGLTKAYAIDEYFYVHQTWTMLHEQEALKVISKGVRFLPLWLFSPLVELGGDNPANMLWLRGQMAFFWLITLGNIGVICAQLYKRWYPQEEPWSTGVWLSAGIGMACAMSIKPLFWAALEMRPDSVAIMCVTGSLALLWGTQETKRSRLGAVLAGVMLFLGVCASVKVLVYGAAFLPLALLSLWKRNRAALPHPVTFSLAFGVCGGLVGVVILTHGSFSEFWHGLYGMAKHHEEHYPVLDPWRLVNPMIRDYPHLVVLGVLGLLEMVRQATLSLYKKRRAGEELLVLGLLVLGWASYFMQKGAYDYSLIPGLAMTCVVVSSITQPLMRWAQSFNAPKVMTALVLMVIAVGVLENVWGRNQKYPRIDEQREVHRKIHTLTHPDDVAYDMSATFVYRPRAHRFAFLDNLRKRLHWQELLRSVPQSIEERETVMFVLDARYWSFHRSSLGKYLQRNFIRYDDDLRFWGRRYDNNQRGWQRQFKSIRTDQYFVYPADWQTYGTLSVDEKPLTSQIFTLEKGAHQVKWTPRPGAKALRSIYIVWLPEDGRPFVPDRSPKRFVLGRYILPGGIRPDPPKR